MSTAHEWLKAGLSTFDLEMDRKQAIDNDTIWPRLMAEIVDDTAVCEAGSCTVCNGEPLRDDDCWKLMTVVQWDYQDPDRWWL
jgi:hypothetical protein